MDNNKLNINRKEFKRKKIFRCIQRTNIAGKKMKYFSYATLLNTYACAPYTCQANNVILNLEDFDFKANTGKSFAIPLTLIKPSTIFEKSAPSCSNTRVNIKRLSKDKPRNRLIDLILYTDNRMYLVTVLKRCHVHLVLFPRT